ncbi:hypothetical protein P5V15_011991 [Pogonomyrmex californicus]
MMYTSKGRYAVVTFLLFTLSHGDSFGRTEARQRYNSAIPPLSWHLVLPWEYMLREVILKSVTPSPLDASAPYRRPLDVSFYGGPMAAYSSDDENVILSRGNVYRLLNGHWMLCQDGCVDCEPCTAQTDPLFTWILRRIKRPPNSNPARHDLQLTIMPQANDHLHANNFWPNYYVYVASQGEQVPTSTIRRQYDNGSEKDPQKEISRELSNLENNFSERHHRSKNFWQLTERDLSTERNGIPQENVYATVQENVSTEKTEQKESPEQKYKLRNMRHRSQSRPVEKPAEEVNQLTPKLILGTDQKGQKHLIHVVPADYPTITKLPTISLSSNYPISSQFKKDQATLSNNTMSKYEKQTYQRIFHRVFDSLNTHRRSIEDFLESPMDNMDDGRRSSSLMDNMEVAGFSWNNRGINYKNNPLHFNDTLLSSSYMGNESKLGNYQNYINRRGSEYMKQKNDRYIVYRDMNQAKISRDRSQTSSNRNLNKEQQKIHIDSYSNIKNNSRIISPLLLQNLDNYSVNVIQRPGFSNDFTINSAKQVNLNDTFVEKAKNNSMESSSITTKRENGQLFGSERLRSGDVKREFEASRHAFRVIVTTKSPVIRSEHETLNRTTVLQMTTPKTFANSL